MGGFYPWPAPPRLQDRLLHGWRDLTRGEMRQPFPLKDNILTYFNVKTLYEIYKPTFINLLNVIGLCVGVCVEGEEGRVFINIFGT